MKYKFTAEVWVYPGETVNWHMAYVPGALSLKIDKQYRAKRRGWSSYPVEVKVGKTVWSTSIFYDKKARAYLLPLKAEVRKKERIQAGDRIAVHLKILV
jgi:hypothetical protein